MLTLSTNAKEAIKIALAITIAYYVALRFSWMSPTWSAIAVAMISLPTAGQSLQKGLLRMGGTLLALVAGFFFLGLFPQDRWLFFISFTPYLAFVSYKMTGKNGQYFWFVAAFVSMMIITAGTGGSTEHVFEFGMYRALETLIGIVIWTLVSVFIWPRSNRGALEEIGQSLLLNYQSFLHEYQACIMGSGSGEKLTIDRSHHGKLLSQFGQTIGAAASESYEVREVRDFWERLQRLALSMMEGMDRLESGYADLQGINVSSVLPEIDMVFSELESRFANARSMLDGNSSPDLCSAISLIANGKDSRALDHFQRAAVQVTINELDKLDAQTRSMVACIGEIKGYEKIEADNSTLVTSRPSGPSRSIGSSMALPVLDADRVRASIMVVMSMWVGVLIWIYFDPPGHVSWYQFVPNIVLIVAQVPHFKINFVKPFAYAYLVALGVFVFIMPKLSMFLELGLVIFLFTFVAAYFFSGVGRTALYLGMFNMFGIQNQQTYDFAAHANTFLFTILALLVVFALSYITRTPRQEKAFLSLMNRYFRSCKFLVSHGADTVKSGSIIERFKRAYYRQELQSLPAKLAAWGGQIDNTKFPNTSAQQIGDMVATLQILTYRIEELERARIAPQSAILTQVLRDDRREWLSVFERKFREWSVHPEAQSVGDLAALLSARLGKLNARFEEVLNSIGEEKISEEEGKNFYQLLGSFRGMSQAAIAYADKAGDIDWVQLREEKF
ncbi:MAG: hypothetical protein GY799_28880 [Desulfobulbaceae bacterium]|nr:hypothetical protein [Desulfobulbaceae bacterium]